MCFDNVEQLEEVLVEDDDVVDGQEDTVLVHEVVDSQVGDRQAGAQDVGAGRGCDVVVPELEMMGQQHLNVNKCEPEVVE